MIKHLILVATLILAACNTNGLNQISAKKIKNEVTGEVEEHRSIKISEDEQNDYFLEIKIPKNYRQVSWNRLSKDNALVNEFIPSDSYETKFVSNFRISEELYSNKSFYDYLMLRKGYIEQVSKTYRSLIEYDLPTQAKSNLSYSLSKSATIIQETLCSPRSGTPCLPNQREINIIKAFQGKTTIWTIEYTKIIDGHLSELEKDEVVKNAEFLINGCCKIEVIKKPINIKNEESN